MLGVRSNAAPLLQDENAFSSLGPQRMNKENGEGVLVGRGARAFGAALSGGKAGVQPLGAVPRKALGNITNATSSKSQQQLGGDGPDKSGSGKEGVRRAFAELTNNAGAAAGPNSSGKGGFGGGAAKPQPLQQLQPAPLGSRSVHTAPRDFPSAGKAPSKAELYALGGVERLAGKGWAQLEAERRQREVAGVQQRVKAALGSTSALRPSLAFMIQADSSSDDDDEQQPAPPSSAAPVRRSMFAAPLATGTTAGDIDLLLCTPAGAGLVDSLPDLPGLNLSADLTFDFDFDDSDDHLLL